MDVVGEEDVRNVPRSVLQKILKRDEDAPLTTQAVRDLQRAQKEKVYRNTLIKIRYALQQPITSFLVFPFDS